MFIFKVDRCSMYPGSLPLIFNGSVPGHEKLFNVRRCSMYTDVHSDNSIALPRTIKATNHSLCTYLHLNDVLL